MAGLGGRIRGGRAGECPPISVAALQMPKPLLASRGLAWCMQAHGALVPRLSITSFLRLCDRLRPPARGPPQTGSAS